MQASSLAVARFECSSASLGFGFALTIMDSIRSTPSLRIVPPRVSLADDEDSPEVVGRRLNVDAVLTGTVDESNGALEASALLVDPRSERELWREQYLGRTTDVAITIQTVADTVSGICTGRRPRASRSQSAIANWDALRAYGEGRSLQWFGGLDASPAAIAFFEIATQSAPRFAPAAAALAYAIAAVGERDRASRERARDAAEHALRIDPRLAEARASLGITIVMSGRPAEGERHLRRALADDPSLEIAHRWRARALLELGRVREAAQEMTWADAIAPHAHFET